MAFLSKTFAIKPLSALLIKLPGKINELYDRRYQYTEGAHAEEKSRIRSKQVHTDACTAIIISIRGRLEDA